MPDDPYSIGDLARLADVTVRTIRYYVTQGLLPSPEAAGPATRYGDAHLARLRLIRRLQRDHLPLAEIRLRLDRMRDDEILATVEALEARTPEPPGTPDDTLGFVQSLMAQSGIPPSTGAPHPPALAPALASAPAPLAELPSMDPTAPYEPSPPTAPDRSTWERLAISPDVELHVRRPLDRRTNKRVEQLERIARELFED